MNADGDAESSATMRFRAINRDVTLIEQKYVLPTGSSAVDFLDTVTECSNGSLLIATVQGRSLTSIVQSLRFSPPIKRGSTASLIKPIVWRSRGAFAMTYSELLARHLSVESAGMYVGYPSDTLTLRVIFPRDYRPRFVDFDVWYGQAEVRSSTEFWALADIHPLRAALTRDGSPEYTLIVPYPVLGLTYAITWLPADTPIDYQVGGVSDK